MHDLRAFILKRHRENVNTDDGNGHTIGSESVFMQFLDDSGVWIALLCSTVAHHRCFGRLEFLMPGDGQSFGCATKPQKGL
jgi:hypothetical protein